MKNAPCFTCLRHSEICHAQCTEYHDWVMDLKSEREAAKVAKQADAHTKRTIERNCKRAKNRKRVGQS